MVEVATPFHMPIAFWTIAVACALVRVPEGALIEVERERGAAVRIDDRLVIDQVERPAAMGGQRDAGDEREGGDATEERSPGSADAAALTASPPSRAAAP